MNLSNKLKELRILAEKATRGNFRTYYSQNAEPELRGYYVRNSHGILCFFRHDLPEAKENSMFLTTANPETILEMCNCIEEMKACLEKRKDDSLHGYYGIKTPEKELLEKYFGEE